MELIGRREDAAPCLELWHDYQFSDVNWINFTFAALDYERVHIYGASEIHAAFFGLHLRLSWVHNKAQNRAFSDDMQERIDGMLQPDPPQETP